MAYTSSSLFIVLLEDRVTVEFVHKRLSKKTTKKKLALTPELKIVYIEKSSPTK